MAVVLPLLSTFNAAGVKAAQASLSGLGGAVAAIGRQAVVATAAFQALQGVINFAGDAISEARDLERNMAALGTVFDNLTPQMNTFVKNAYDMGLSQVEAARTSTFLGSVLKQAGLPMDQVAQKTKDLTILAQDLATTYGYDTSEALTAMTALFRGEYDPIEKFGVALKQNEVNALVAAKGLGHLTGQQLLNAQQTVRMEQLFLRSADAQGAFARQSGTLFVEQKKLNAVFENMQATVGQQLTPTIASLMQTLTPIVNELSPRLEQTFALIADNIVNLTPMIQPVADSLFALLDIFNTLGDLVAPLAKSVSAVLTVALTNLSDVVERAAYWFGVLAEKVKEFNLTVDETKPAPITEWLKSIGERLGSFNLLYNMMVQFKEQVIATNDAMAFAEGMSMGTQSRSWGRERNALIQRGLYKPAKNTAPQDGKNYVAEFYKALADEIAQQKASLKLKNLGASEEFIQSIIGSGKGWEKVFANVMAQGKTGIQRLQAQFNQTATGKTAIFKKLEEAAKAAHEAAMEQYRKDLDVYNDQKRLFDAQVEAIANFKDQIAGITDSLKPIAIATREIGQFEQATIQSFQNIADTIKNALKQSTITQAAADELNKYANAEKQALIKINQQRDEIANKRSLAKALLEDVKSAVVGLGNITNILKSDAGDITQTITKMVGNIQVTTSKVIKGIIGGPTELVNSFKDIVAKTKTFAAQLKELRALGLDKNLYQQIVDAGIDAGGTTAKAILEGGAGTVNELNNLFAELDATGASIGEQSAQVMYGAGVNITNGIIEGLISQEQLLVDQATKMADAFINAFNTKMSTFVVPTISVPNMPTEPVYQAPAMPTTQDVTYSLAELKKINLATVTSDPIWKENAKLAAKLIATPQYKASNVINVTVSSAVTTNGKTVGKEIQNVLKQYLKASSK